MTPKQTRPARRRAAALAALGGAVASAALWAGPAAAQGPAPGGGPGISELADPHESPEAARAARLDALFAALAEAETGEHGRIEQEIRRIWSRSGSDTADLLLARGRTALEARNFVRAIHHLTALVEIAPDFAEGWNLRATAFFARGDLGPSLTDIERTLELEPRHFGALSGLAVILEQMGREPEALAAYREARRLNPHLPRIDEAVDRLAPKVDGRDI